MRMYTCIRLLCMCYYACVTFSTLQVPDEVLIERMVGRRLDPETGAIYHLKFKPPPPEVVDRLQQRSDDTEEKVSVQIFAWITGDCRWAATALGFGQRGAGAGPAFCVRKQDCPLLGAALDNTEEKVLIFSDVKMPRLSTRSSTA